MSGVLNKPRIEAYVGASGSGKGVSITARLKELKPQRLLIWDPRDEYGKQAPAHTSMQGLVKAFSAAKGGPVKARFVPGAALPLAQSFEVVCRLAFQAGDMVFLAEELSDVTTASHAPAAWRQCVTQGRHQRLHLIGAAQRPALIDKTFLGNATYLRCFTLRYREDRLTMSRALDVPEADIAELQTVEDESSGSTVINYLERDFRAGLLGGGSIKLKRATSQQRTP